MRVLFCYPHVTGLNVVVKTPAPGKLVGSEVMITDEDWDVYQRRYKPNTFQMTGRGQTILGRAVVQIRLASDVFMVSHIFPNGCISVELQRSPELPAFADELVVVVPR